VTATLGGAAGQTRLALLLGLGLIALSRRPQAVATYAQVLVAGCCGIGYAYQGHRLRLTLSGSGLLVASVFCWRRLVTGEASPYFWRWCVPWRSAIALGGRARIATQLWCSYSPNYPTRWMKDAAHGKRSPVGPARHARQRRDLVPWFHRPDLALPVGAGMLAGRWRLKLALLGSDTAAATSLV